MSNKLQVKGFKVKFQFIFHAVNLAVGFPCQLQIQVKRGTQKILSKGQYDLDLIQKVSNFKDEEICLVSSIYMNKATNNYLEKKISFTAIIITPKGQRVVGSSRYNLADLLNKKYQEKQEILPIKNCPDKKAQLCLTFKQTVIEEMKDVDTLSQMTRSPPTSIQSNNQAAFFAEQQASVDAMSSSGTKKPLDKSQVKPSSFLKGGAGMNDVGAMNKDLPAFQRLNSRNQKSSNTLNPNQNKQQLDQQQQKPSNSSNNLDESTDKENNKLQNSDIKEDKTIIQNSKINNESFLKNKRENSGQKQVQQQQNDKQQFPTMAVNNLFGSGNKSQIKENSGQKQDQQKQNGDINSNSNVSSQKYMEEIVSLQKQLKQKDEHINQIKQKGMQYKAQYEEAQQKAMNVSKELLEQKAKFLELQQKSLLIQQQQKQQLEDQDSSEVNEKQKQQIEQLQQKVSSFEEELKNQKLKYKGLKSENKELKESLEKEKKNLSKSNISTASSVKSNEDSAFLKNQIKKLETRLQTIDEEYQNQMEEKETEINELETENQKLQKKANKNQNKIQNFEMENNQSKQQYEILKSQYKQLEKELVKSKQLVGDFLNSANDFGGPELVDKMQQALFQ